MDKTSIHTGKCGHKEEEADICQFLLWSCMQTLFRDKFNKLQRQLNNQSTIRNFGSFHSDWINSIFLQNSMYIPIWADYGFEDLFFLNEALFMYQGL